MFTESFVQTSVCFSDVQNVRAARAGNGVDDNGRLAGHVVGNFEFKLLRGAKVPAGQAFGSITGRGARYDVNRVCVGYRLQPTFDKKSAEVRWTAVCDGGALEISWEMCR